AYHVNSPVDSLPPPVFSPLPVSGPMFVSYESRPYRSPALTTCVSCRTQVTTEVTFKVGAYAWLLCLVFVLVLGCCLIPFFVNHFKDAYHTCPRCKRVLHIQRRELFKSCRSLFIHLFSGRAHLLKRVRSHRRLGYKRSGCLLFQGR
uniref:LITAF domain-containing protein n=1 Tax=Kryptolebias marmoratus TaxID=37003 RepID=A0A3Q3A3N1_KRYMA